MSAAAKFRAALAAERPLQIVGAVNAYTAMLAEKSGFKVSMRQREAIFKNGELYDNLVMDMLREEYFVRHPDLEDKLPPFEG